MRQRRGEARLRPAARRAAQPPTTPTQMPSAKRGRQRQERRLVPSHGRSLADGHVLAERGELLRAHARGCREARRGIRSARAARAPRRCGGPGSGRRRAACAISSDAGVVEVERAGISRPGRAATAGRRVEAAAARAPARRPRRGRRPSGAPARGRGAGGMGGGGSSRSKRSSRSAASGKPARHSRTPRPTRKIAARSRRSLSCGRE